ncbi:hypothetical protein CAPTEDRAFT_195931 [Capitella teleta]|uniref:Uncharacterized protein n=1 Tax=Capitella teleta TaxID=283909 RepID=R7UM36_CAPTE|nr:hypothetical protein CAPTEDRAFT_195931 [Capitella teleta]|eukprot:ELU07295.1 hypothetical protein CAPTEDRAFT_195931 [Capitella teleta]
MSGKGSTSAWQEHKAPDNCENPEEKEKFVDYATNATIHGLGHAANRENGKIRRVVWAIILLSMVAYFAFTITLMMQKLSGRPVSSRTRVIEVDEIFYPAMTICNINQIKKPYVANDSFLADVIEALSRSSTPEPLNIGINLNDPVVVDRLENEYPPLREIFHDGAFTLSEMVYICWWRTQYVDCRDFFTTTLTALGYCFTFNSGERINEKGGLKTAQTGVQQGFTFMINVSQENYFHQKGYSAGLRLLVHDPYDWPSVEASGIAISPGTETFLSVKTSKTKKMPPPYGGNTCMDTNDVNFHNPLKYSDKYSQSRCKQDCYIDFMLKQCECVFFDFEIKKEYLTNSTHLKQCACRPQCFRNAFEVTKSEAYFPSDKTSVDLKSTPGVMPPSFNESDDPTNYLRRNYLALNLFMSELSYTLYEEEAAYTANDFQADFGGNMGLCLGASFMSLAELAEILLIGIIGLAYKMSRMNRINRPVPIV